MMPIDTGKCGQNIARCHTGEECLKTRTEKSVRLGEGGRIVHRLRAAAARERSNVELKSREYPDSDRDTPRRAADGRVRHI